MTDSSDESKVLATANGEHVGFLNTASGESTGSVPACDTVRDRKGAPDGRLELEKLSAPDLKEKNESRYDGSPRIHGNKVARKDINA